MANNIIFIARKNNKIYNYFCVKESVTFMLSILALNMSKYVAKKCATCYHIEGNTILLFSKQNMVCALLS